VPNEKRMTKWRMAMTEWQDVKSVKTSILGCWIEVLDGLMDREI
jgi:hypothetical protein